MAMSEKSKVSAELERLTARIGTLESRLSAVEAGLARVQRGEGGAELEAEREPAPGAASSDLAAGLPALLGRTIMALGGAFLLRAFTESGALRDDVGIASGLAYALLWTALADRAARAGRPLDATLHGLTTILIAFPLIAETTVRLQAMSPAVAASTLTVIAAVVLAVAWLRRLPALAWIVTLASTATGVALLFATRRLWMFTPPLFLLAAASLAASFSREWYGLRWPAALALDVLVVLAMLLIGLPSYEWLQPGGVAAVQLLMTAMYLGIIGVRTLVLGHPVREFGVVQSLIVLAIGLEGARRLLGPDVAAAGAFAWVALALATLFYGLSFLRLERDPSQAANLAWYTTLATILAVYGTWLLAPIEVAGVVWAAMAFAGALAGTRPHRRALRWNVAALAIAAAIASGLARTAYAAFGAADPRRWMPLPWPVAAVTAACLAAWLILRRRSRLPRGVDHAAAGLALLAVGAVGVGSACVTFLGPVAAGAASPEPDLAALAVVRTAVLVAASLLLAGLVRLGRGRELAWAAYAALVLTALKILVEDLPNGRAMTLFLSFVLFGGALIVVPRLAARPAEPERENPVVPEPARGPAAGADESGAALRSAPR